MTIKALLFAEKIKKLLLLFIIRLSLPDECVSTKLRVAVNHVCFHLVTQFYYYYYYYSSGSSMYRTCQKGA